MRCFMRPMMCLAIVSTLVGCGDSGGGDTTLGGAHFGASTEPPLETDLATLDAALICTPFTHPDKPPVLLVHGTFTNGPEQYDWTVGSSRVDLQACKLEYSIVSPK